MKLLFILLITLLPFGSVVRAQDTLPRVPHYNFRLDSTTIMLGDQTVLAVEKTHLYPSLDDLTNNDIVAVRQWMDTADGTLYTALTSFEEGEHWLHIGDDSVMLTVNDMPGVDTTSAEIRDIANIMSQPYTFELPLRMTQGCTLSLIGHVCQCLHHDTPASSPFRVWWATMSRTLPMPPDSHRQR